MIAVVSRTIRTVNGSPWSQQIVASAQQIVASASFPFSKRFASVEPLPQTAAVKSKAKVRMAALYNV